jgi:hypothetical protein
VKLRFTPHRVGGTAAIPLFAALAKPAVTGHKNRWEETPAESCIDD